MLYPICLTLTSYLHYQTTINTVKGELRFAKSLVKCFKRRPFREASDCTPRYCPTEPVLAVVLPKETVVVEALHIVDHFHHPSILHASSSHTSCRKCPIPVEDLEAITVPSETAFPFFRNYGIVLSSYECD